MCCKSQHFCGIKEFTELLCIKKITADELILIRGETKYEDFYKMTCRPILKREENELEEIYNNFIQKENTVIFSITRKEDGVLIGIIRLNKIYAQTASFNAESIGLLKKMYFKKDAVLRDHHELEGKLYDDYIFSVLGKEWELKYKKKILHSDTGI